MIEFDELVRDDFTRERVIVTFLALLELCRLRMIRIFQNTQQGGIRLIPAVVEETVNESITELSAE